MFLISVKNVFLNCPFYDFVEEEVGEILQAIMGEIEESGIRALFDEAEIVHMREQFD